MMMEALVPPGATVEEATGPVPGAELYPEEQLRIANAVERRREEFTSARACARRGLVRLGLPAQAIGTGPHGEPLWPIGVVGSITHCRGYRGSVVARAAALGSIGIDAEPHEPLPDGVLATVAFGAELSMLGDLTAMAPDICWDRLLFSAKESIYKAWFPLAHRWLGFEDVSLTLDRDAGTFAGELLVPGPALADGPLRRLSGRWTVTRGLILTCCCVT